VAVDVIMPKIGMYTEDIRLVEWLTAEGAEVKAGELLFVLETDKVTNEVEADAAGFLHQLVAGDSMVPIGGVVGALAESREEYEQLLAVVRETPPAADVSAFEPAQSELFLDYIRSADEAVAPSPTQKVSPRARALIEKSGLASEVVERIPATGPDGRLTDKDVRAFLDALSPPSTPGVAILPSRVELGVAARIPLRGKRRAIARRMLESLQTTAQLTSILEVDVGELVAWRSRSKPRPGYTAIFIAIAAQALRRHPIVNSRVAGDEIELLAEVNIAFAVDVEDGVIAPVVRGADALSLAELDSRVSELTERARAGTIQLAELDGGTFTLSNSGVAAVDITTAIINPPQAAILWLGRIRERPTVVDGTVVARPTLQACLTYDHRVIDGVPAARFLETFEELARGFPPSPLAR
jgi:pyruvate/2-oxoglutarate dehydrogenase complex dihydrolipoamide acyltransferase (E2) component